MQKAVVLSRAQLLGACICTILCLLPTHRVVADQGAPNATFIDAHAAPPTIVIGAQATASEQFAAHELADYLGKITGQHLNIVDDNHVPGGKLIAVGKSKLTDSFDISSLGIEQYIIDVTPNQLTIIGGRLPPLPNGWVRDRGTLYGVYELLDRLGVRWYRPEEWGEYVPTMQQLALPLGRTVSRPPAYIMRSGPFTAFQRYAEVTPSMRARCELWMVRNHLSDISNDKRYGGHVAYRFLHSYPDLFPPSQYFEKHPEYYALIDGKRNPKAQLCLGNPELQDEFAKKIIAEAKAHPELDSYTVEPSDGGDNFCQCPLCKAMDDPAHPDNMSDRVCAFNNIIARRLAAEVPGAKIQCLAYSSYTSVPTRVIRLEPNTIIQPATINSWGNYSHKLSEPVNAPLRNALKGWYNMGPAALMTYEYWSGYGWPGPLPLTRTMADRLKHYPEYHVIGIENEFHPHWGPQGMDDYMFARLVWNPDLDVNRELDLYYHNYYGPAAVPMKAYHEALMDEFEKHDVHSGGRGMKDVMTPALIEKLGPYITEAQALVKGQPLYEKRMVGVAAGYEFGRRICDIVQLTKAAAAANGDAARLAHADAEAKFQELKQFVESFNDTGDAVFDVSPEDKTGDHPISVSLAYLTTDLGMTWNATSDTVTK